MMGSTSKNIGWSPPDEDGFALQICVAVNVEVSMFAQGVNNAQVSTFANNHSELDSMSSGFQERTMPWKPNPNAKEFKPKFGVQNMILATQITYNSRPTSNKTISKSTSHLSKILKIEHIKAVSKFVSNSASKFTKATSSTTFTKEKSAEVSKPATAMESWTGINKRSTLRSHSKNTKECDPGIAMLANDITTSTTKAPTIIHPSNKANSKASKIDTPRPQPRNTKPAAIKEWTGTLKRYELQGHSMNPKGLWAGGKSCGVLSSDRMEVLVFTQDRQGDRK